MRPGGLYLLALAGVDVGVVIGRPQRNFGFPCIRHRSRFSWRRRGAAIGIVLDRLRCRRMRGCVLSVRARLLGCCPRSCGGFAGGCAGRSAFVAPGCRRPGSRRLPWPPRPRRRPHPLLPLRPWRVPNRLLGTPECGTLPASGGHLTAGRPPEQTELRVVQRDVEPVHSRCSRRRHLLRRTGRHRFRARWSGPGRRFRCPACR